MRALINQRIYIRLKTIFPLLIITIVNRMDTQVIIIIVQLKLMPEKKAQQHKSMVRIDNKMFDILFIAFPSILVSLFITDRFFAIAFQFIYPQELL